MQRAPLLVLCNDLDNTAYQTQLASKMKKFIQSFYTIKAQLLATALQMRFWPRSCCTHGLLVYLVSASPRGSVSRHL